MKAHHERVKKMIAEIDRVANISLTYEYIKDQPALEHPINYKIIFAKQLIKILNDEDDS